MDAGLLQFHAALSQAATRVEEALGTLLPSDESSLGAAMRYAVLGGGKRLRAFVATESAAIFRVPPAQAIRTAAAVECVHAYSLVHDDLPCMDDDDLRRGRPTNHVVFGEYTAVIAGDALQAAAFETILKAPLDAEKKAEAALALAKAAGAYGMCAGQQLDMEGEGRRFSLAEVEQTHRLKTAALIKAAASMGCIAAGASKARIEAAEKYAEALGLAFQIRDDLLDVTGSAEILGKNVGSDAESGKSTFVTLLGVDRCRELVYENTERAKAALKGAFSNTEFLEWFAELLAGREK